MARRSTLRVLTYHRVLEPGGRTPARPESISATPATFAEHMRHVAKHYRVVTPPEVLDALQGGRPLPRRALLLTFDDAYCDFAEHAWPVLRRHRLPATLFVPTGYPGRVGCEFWWDRLYRVFRLTTQRALELPPFGRISLESAQERRTGLRRIEVALLAMPHHDAMCLVARICEQLGDHGEPTTRVLGWHELRALAKEGVTLAPHSRTHPALTWLPLEEVREELRGSRDDLRREIGEVAPIFAYPHGAHDDRVVRLAREEGFRLALTCIAGQNELGKTDPLRLRRTNVSTRTSSFLLRARLNPLVAYVDGWRQRKPGAYALPRPS